jgi:hypothetical protein
LRRYIKGYNTDYSAAIGAIEAAMVLRLGGDAEGVLKGKTVGSDTFKFIGRTP